MKKEIDAWIYDPTRSLFKKKKTEKAVGYIIYCECHEKCELYAKHKCIVYNNKCPYGSRGVCNSNTPMHNEIIELVNKNINLIRQVV